MADPILIRNEKDFLYPEQTRTQKLFTPISRLTAVTYDQFIDESIWQYVNGKSINHKAALDGGFVGTIIRASDGLTVDNAWKTGNWQKALDDGQVVMVYHNNQAVHSGLSQADFHIKTIQPFIDAIGAERVCIWLDCENTNDGVSIPTRQRTMLDFVNRINTLGYKVGIYSNINFWNTLYGNIVPPPFVWLWGAHWTGAVMGSFPTVWDINRVIAWQYGVWDNYSWCKAVPGNTPDIDVDKWIWKGGSMKTFLNWEVTPPTDLEKLVKDLQAQVASLDTKVTELDAKFTMQINALTSRVTALENKKYPLPLQVASYVPDETSIAYRLKDFNAKSNEIFDFYPTGSSDDVSKRIKISKPTQVLVEPVYLGDGGAKMYLIVDSTLKATVPIFADATKGHLSP